MEKKLKSYFKKMKISLLVLGIAGSLILISYACKRELFSEIKTEIDGGESSQVIKTRSGEQVWNYPVRPGMESWNSLRTEEERIAVLQVPENILASLPSEEIVGLCITFPAFGHFTAWNTPQDGFNIMLERYNILRHLLLREDTGRNLIRAYKDANLTGFKTLPYSNEFWALKLCYIELLLSQKEILQSLTPEEKLELIIEASAKIIEKANNEAFNGLPDILFPFRIMVNILDIERYPEFMVLANNETVSQFINMGWVFEDVLPVQEIVNVINNYVKAKQIIIIDEK